jgi:hypothetical protein
MLASNVKKYVDEAIVSESLQRAQLKRVGAMISNFLLVRDGLEGRVPHAELNAIAATLTAGIWGSND